MIVTAGSSPSSLMRLILSLLVMAVRRRCPGGERTPAAPQILMANACIPAPSSFPNSKVPVRCSRPPLAAMADSVVCLRRGLGKGFLFYEHWTVARTV